LPEEIVLTREWLDSHFDLIKDLPARTIVHEVTPDVLAASITTVNPDGVATLLSLQALPQEHKEPDFVLALDRLQDPGNLGTLLRTALAAEVDAVWLASGADPLHPKVLRSSAGAILHVPYNRFGLSMDLAVQQLAEHLKNAAKAGKQIVATVVPSSLGLPTFWPNGSWNG